MTSGNRHDAKPAPDDERKPASPTDIRPPSWRFILKQTVREFMDDQCTDIAAALTYYAVLAASVALFLVMSRFVHSPLGRTLQAIRDNELRAEALVTSAAIPGIPGDGRFVPALETTDGAGAATSLVAHGVGVAMLPDYCLRGDPLVRAGAIAHRPLDGDRMAVSLLCLHRRGAPPATAAALQERLLVHARR